MPTDEEVFTLLKKPQGVSDEDVSNFLSSDAVINEQHPEVERQKIMNLAPNSRAAAEYLRGKDFEVREKGGDYDFDIRKKGEKEYRKLDPEGFDIGDIADIGTDTLKGVASGVGGLAGGASLAVTGPGAFFAGAGGAMAGGAAAETVKQAIARLAGFKQTGMEALRDVGIEAALGFGTEAGLRGIATAAKPLVRKLGTANPLKMPYAAEGLLSGRTKHEADRQALRALGAQEAELTAKKAPILARRRDISDQLADLQAQRGMVGVRESGLGIPKSELSDEMLAARILTQPPIAEKGAAWAALLQKREAERMAAKAAGEATEQTAKAVPPSTIKPDLGDAVSRGPMGNPSRPGSKNVIEELESLVPKDTSRVGMFRDMSMETLHPAMILARYKRVWPGAQRALKTAYGDNAYNDITSASMENLWDHLTRMRMRMSPEEWAARNAIWQKEITREIMTDPTFEILQQNEKEALARIAKGMGAGGDQETLAGAIGKVASEKANSPELERYLQSIPPAAEAQAQRQKNVIRFGQRKAELRQQETELKRDKQALIEKIMAIRQGPGMDTRRQLTDIRRVEPEIAAKKAELAARGVTDQDEIIRALQETKLGRVIRGGLRTSAALGEGAEKVLAAILRKAPGIQKAGKKAAPWAARSAVHALGR